MSGTSLWRNDDPREALPVKEQGEHLIAVFDSKNKIVLEGFVQNGKWWWVHFYRVLPGQEYVGSGRDWPPHLYWAMLPGNPEPRK